MDQNNLNDNLNMNLNGDEVPVYDPGILPGGYEQGAYTQPPYVAPQFEQAPYGSPQPGQAPPPYAQMPVAQPVSQPQDPNVYTDEDKKKANIICLVSLFCFFVVPFLEVAIIESFNSIMNSVSSVEETGHVIRGGLGSMSFIAAWALMIYVRVRYKKSIFGKVLMWLYISLLILFVVFIVAIIVACGQAIKNCPG